MGHYRRVAIQTFHNLGEPSSRSLRARPLPGQGLDIGMRVECSSRMRDQYPPGTVFIVHAKVTDREGGQRFLYTHFAWPYEVVDPATAQERIARGQL